MILIELENKNGENTLYAKNLKNSFNQASDDNSKVTYLDSTQKRSINSTKNFNLKSNESANQNNTMKISVRRRNNANDGNFGGKILVQKNNNFERRVRNRK